MIMYLVYLCNKDKKTNMTFFLQKKCLKNKLYRTKTVGKLGNENVHMGRFIQLALGQPLKKLPELNMLGVNRWKISH